MSNHNKSLHDGPINVPAGRPWWHIPAGIAAGVIVIGGGTVGYLQMTHHDLHPVAVTKKTRTKKDPATVATGPVTPPNYVHSTNPKTGHVFQAIAAINNKYIAWADQQISQAVPAIPSSGTYAGTMTAGILNSPLTLKKWPGPHVPRSLSAAGVKLPVGTPANGSIVGLTQADVTTAFNATRFWPKLTPQELMGAYQVAAKYVMAATGNHPTSMFQYTDPYTDGGNLDQSIMSNTITGNIAGDFTGPASQGGMLPLRQVNYLNWVSYSMNPTNYSTDGSKLGFVTPTTTSPHGHVIVGNVNITGLTDHIVGTVMVHGKLVIGQYSGQIGDVSLALIQDGSTSRWYVTGAGGISGSNVPTATYWTAP